MMGEVNAALDGVDVLALILDVSEDIGKGDRHAIERAARFEGTRILLLNKVDRIPKDSLLPIIESVGKLTDFAEIIPISALTGDGVDRVLEKFIEYLPSGEPHFPADQYTDQPERFLAAELIREKAMAGTFHEVPHAVAVLVDAFEETDKLIRIRATIYVEREGQKGILIGRAGASLKKIGTDARKELEEILGMKIFLELFVKVLRDWRDNPQLVRQLDWHLQLERLTGE
jgi:GTP-binding protein Era